MSSKTETPPEWNGSEVAVIGMAGRFPGAPTVERFWENLRDGVESIRFFTDEELLAAGRRPRAASRDPAYVKAAAGARRRRAVRRRLLRLHPARGRAHRPAAAALPGVRLGGAGATPATTRSRYRGPVGVFAGVEHEHATCSEPALATRELLEPARRAARSTIGNDKDFLATRVSYKLNLRGPEPHRADRLLDLAGRGPPRLPEPARRRVRHGARRRRLGRACRSARATSTRRGASSRRTATAAPSTPRPQGTVVGNGVRRRACSSGWTTRWPTATRSTP